MTIFNSKNLSRFFLPSAIFLPAEKPVCRTAQSFLLAVPACKRAPHNGVSKEAEQEKKNNQE
jgi:hypothetical protein